MPATERLIVTELHFHRNGVYGEGYYAGRAEWHVNDGDVFRVMFTAFISADPEAKTAPGHIAILADGDLSTSFRYEDFALPLRRFCESRGGQAMAFPHTIFQRAA